MKKVLLLVGLLALSSPVGAVCQGGYEFKGQNNPYTYCVSTVKMNWWSAFAWCQAQGYHLAKWEEAQPNASSLRWDSDCSANLSADLYNMPGDRFPWLARSGDDLENKTALGICKRSAGGWHSVKEFNRTELRTALCVE